MYATFLALIRVRNIIDMAASKPWIPNKYAQAQTIVHQ